MVLPEISSLLSKISTRILSIQTPHQKYGFSLRFLDNEPLQILQIFGCGSTHIHSDPNKAVQKTQTLDT